MSSPSGSCSHQSESMCHSSSSSRLLVVKVEQLWENKTGKLREHKQLLKARVSQQANNSQVLNGPQLLHYAEFRLPTCTAENISFPYYILLFYSTILVQWIWGCFINACISPFNFYGKLIHKKQVYKSIFYSVTCIGSSHWLLVWQALVKI